MAVGAYVLALAVSGLAVLIPQAIRWIIDAGIIVHADVICVVDGGKIIETGSHADLLAGRGLYYALYERQFVRMG